MEVRKEDIRGIMFDMDNTLLRSRIDFPTMKRDVYALLSQHGFAAPAAADLAAYTTSMLIDMAKREGLHDDLHSSVMALTAEHEVRGMAGAGLEPGAAELLEELHGKYALAIVTNNSCKAAERALAHTGILDRFELVIGREQMAEMKPSPSGYLEAVRRSGIEAIGWISIGDSWIDGKGSMDAGIPFVCYGEASAMRDRGVMPIHAIGRLEELLLWLNG